MNPSTEEALPFDLEHVNRLVEFLTEFAVGYSMQIIGAIIILCLGVIASRWARHGVGTLCDKRNLDVTLSKFAANIAGYLVIGFAVIVALGKFGFTIAPFVAALGAATFGLSFAIQGPISNYGAGLVIIVTRPFVVGNTIRVAGVHGVVEEVTLGFTILTDEDGVRIYVPNKHIVGEVIQNSDAYRIVEGVIGVSYSDDPDVAIRVIREAVDGVEGVVQAPKPQVGIEQFADSSVNIAYRCWVPTQTYYQQLYVVNRAVYRAVNDAGLTIPFPQRDVHLDSASSGQSG